MATVENPLYTKEAHVQALFQGAFPWHEKEYPLPGYYQQEFERVIYEALEQLPAWSRLFGKLKWNPDQTKRVFSEMIEEIKNRKIFPGFLQDAQGKEFAVLKVPAIFPAVLATRVAPSLIINGFTVAAQTIILDSRASASFIRELPRPTGSRSPKNA